MYDTQGLYLANAIANSWQTGPIYSFTQWAPSATPGLYPIKMTFRCSSTMDPNISHPITADYTGHTNVGVTSFGVRGENANGISVLNTGTANANCGNGFLAAIDISIDTSNRTNIQVSWKAAQISDQTREYGLRLQHNCGGGGSFTDVPGHEFSSVTAGTSTSYFSYGPTTLPALCNNKANAVLRWRYYYISGSGNRTRIALDDVEVTGTP